jgi:sugar phosphate isomerase/epimerase
MQRRNFIKTSGISAAGISLSSTGLAGNIFLAQAKKRPICAFTKCLQFLSIEESANALAKMGFDGADLAVRKNGQIEPENAKTELPKAVKMHHDAGISVPMMVTGITNAEDPVSVELLQVAAECGIKYYRMGYVKYDPSKTIQENLDVYKKQFEKLAGLNEKLGLHGAYQNHSGSYVGAPVWDLLELVKDINPEYLGVQYDIRHAVVEGAYSWKFGMKRIAPWIRTICIKDFIWQKNENNWSLQNVMLGEGMVGFDEFFKEYRNLEIEAPVTIHFEYDLGGAEHGKKEISMEPEKIYSFMKKDLAWLQNSFEKHKIES